MQDISGTGHLHADCNHPVGPFLYDFLHAVHVGLACRGRPGARGDVGQGDGSQMLGEAGFPGNVPCESLEHDPMNFWYIAAV